MCGRINCNLVFYLTIVNFAKCYGDKREEKGMARGQMRNVYVKPWYSGDTVW